MNGSIPAWAGETRRAGGVHPRYRVYPRVGGGNQIRKSRSSAVRGLSPRGRGKLLAAGFCLGVTRSIPAWAGETMTRPGNTTPPRVYPRVGGGNRSGGWTPGRAFRSIPAWAGETPMPSPTSQKGRVYPRVGGGNPVFVQVAAGRQGLSPRGRGKPPLPQQVFLPLRSIPAWAGETCWGKV